MEHSATMNQPKFRYTEKEMKIALKQSLGLCIRGLIAVWQYCPRYNPEYTSEVSEKLRGFKSRGFSSSEEIFMLELVKRVVADGNLNPPQQKALLKRMPRYARDLARIGNLDPAHRLDKIDLPTAKEAVEVSSKLVWFYIKDRELDRRGAHFKAEIATGANDMTQFRGTGTIRSFPTKSVKYEEMVFEDNTPMGETFIDVQVIGVPQWLCTKLGLDDEKNYTEEIENLINSYRSKN